MRSGTTPEAGFEILEARDLALETVMLGLPTADGIDLTQWYNILNVEIEVDIAPDGFGPFDLVSAAESSDQAYSTRHSSSSGVNTAARISL